MSSTQIPAAKAKEYIEYYEQGLPPGAMRSGWLNKDIIDAIVELSKTHKLDGLRVYLAKYTEDDSKGRFKKDEDTMIVVPTEDGFVGAKKDVEDAYFDYTFICPPHCP
jgi:hypothetical protein